MKKFNFIKLILSKSILFLFLIIFSNCNNGVLDLYSSGNQIDPYPIALFNNTPANPSDDTELKVTVSGVGVVDYQYKLVTQDEVCTGGGYNGSWIPVDIPITDAIEIEDDYKLCVIGRDEDLDIQTEDEATSYVWTRGVYWELEVTTIVPNQNMTIDFDNPVDIDIVWGDGNKDTINEVSVTHTYSAIGVYILKIRGQASRIHFDNADAQKSLTQILSVIRKIDGVTSFQRTFYNCTALTSIPAGLFNNNPAVTSFEDTFYGCTGLTSIPGGLFGNNTQVITFQRTFRGCLNLTGPIPSGLFDSNTQVVTFQSIFSGCVNLSGSIPTGLFEKNIQVTSFERTFYRCSGLASIPEGLFDKNAKVVSFERTFFGCTGLKGFIPPGLFDNNILVTTFRSVFSDCLNLTGSIPSGLFDKNTKVISFEKTFYGCSGLTDTIPAGLFDKNILVTTFRNTFSGCSNLTDSIPEGLFDKNTQVISFEYTFYRCSGLTSIPPGLFDKNTEVITFEGTFSSAKRIANNVPDLWNTHSSAYGIKCFYNITRVLNFGDIPPDWK